MSQLYTLSLTRIFGALLIGVALCGSFACAGESLGFGYMVSSQSAPVYKEPSLNSQVLTTLRVTQRLTGATYDPTYHLEITQIYRKK